MIGEKTETFFLITTKNILFLNLTTVQTCWSEKKHQHAKTETRIHPWATFPAHLWAVSLHLVLGGDHLGDNTEDWSSLEQTTTEQSSMSTVGHPLPAS